MPPLLEIPYVFHSIEKDHSMRNVTPRSLFTKEGVFNGNG